MRPADLPVEVLWTFKDYKADPDVNVTQSNASRPPMEKAIHRGDGMIITPSEWNAIKTTVCMVKMELLQLPRKSYFTFNH